MSTPTGRELAMLHWSMPTPPYLLNGKPDSGVTNIRNVDSPHWRRWLGPANRCLAPWTTFCEYEGEKGAKRKRWFAIDDTRPLAFFAGLWTEWNGVRGSVKTPRPGTHQLFGLLTCDPNDIVAPIHPKAMPVILTEPEEIEIWMNASWEEARHFSAHCRMIGWCCCRWKARWRRNERRNTTGGGEGTHPREPLLQHRRMREVGRIWLRSVERPRNALAVLAALSAPGAKQPSFQQVMYASAVRLLFLPY